MTVLRGFGIVGASAMLCALVGLGIGYGLAVAIPSYYRGVFRDGNSPNFDPVQVGMGLGLSQGVIAGLVVGCVVVLAVAWYNSRRQIVIQDVGSLRWGLTTATKAGESEAYRQAEMLRLAAELETATKAGESEAFRPSAPPNR
jgi:hypothetical protein